MKNKYLVIIGLILIFATGCQQENKQDVLIVEEGEYWNSYDSINQLKVVTKEGESKLISPDVKSWEVIRENGEDIIYYTDATTTVDGGGNKESVGNKVLRTYNLVTGDENNIYTMPDDENEYILTEYMRVIKDEKTSRNYLGLSETNGLLDKIVFVLIDLDSGKKVFEEGDIYLGDHIYIYDDVIFYGEGALGTGPLLYDLMKQEKVEYVTKQGEQLGDEDFLHFVHQDKGSLYFNRITDYEGINGSETVSSIEEVNIKTGIQKELISEDYQSGWIMDTVRSGDFLYTYKDTDNETGGFSVTDIKNKARHKIAEHYIGKDDKYFYVYDYAEDRDELDYDRFGIYEKGDGPKKLLTPERLFQDTTKLYRVPIGSMTPEPASLEAFRMYLDYDEFNSIVYKYMNPIIKEGYTSRPSSDGKYGLYEQDEEVPFYETKDDITRFEKIVIPKNRVVQGVTRQELEETVIPEEDNVLVEIEADDDEFVDIYGEVFVVAEADDWDEDWSISNKLRLVDKEGRRKLIVDQIEDWRIMKMDGENLVYYAEIRNNEDDSSRSLKSYSIKTGEEKSLHTIKGTDEITFLEDKGTGRNFVVLREEAIEEEEYSHLGHLKLIDMTTNKIVFEESNVVTGRPMHIYEGIFCYVQVDDQGVNEAETKLAKVMSYDLDKKKKKTIFSLLDLYEDMESLMKTTENCMIAYEEKENIYVSVYYDGRELGDGGHDSDLYEVNIKTGAKTKIEHGEGSAWEIMKEGDYLYFVKEEYKVSIPLSAYHIKNKEAYHLGQFYLGQDDQYLYVYDDEKEYLYGNYGEEYEYDCMEKNIKPKVKTPEELFKDPSKLYRIAKGSTKRESASLDDLKKYLDYDTHSAFSFNYKFMNPIIKEGYISRPSTQGKYGLYKENEERPFYNTNNDITGFEFCN